MVVCQLFKLFQETDGSPCATQAFDQPQEEEVKENVEEKIPQRSGSEFNIATFLLFLFEFVFLIFLVIPSKLFSVPC